MIWVLTSLLLVLPVGVLGILALLHRHRQMVILGGVFLAIAVVMLSIGAVISLGTGESGDNTESPFPFRVRFVYWGVGSLLFDNLAALLSIPFIVGGGRQRSPDEGAARPR